MNTGGNYSHTVDANSFKGVQVWPTRSLRVPGFSFQTGPGFGTVIRLGSLRFNLTLTINR